MLLREYVFQPHFPWRQPLPPVCRPRGLRHSSPLARVIPSRINSPCLPTKTLTPEPPTPGNASRHRGRGRSKRKRRSKAGPPDARLWGARPGQAGAAHASGRAHPQGGRARMSPQRCRARSPAWARRGGGRGSRAVWPSGCSASATGMRRDMEDQSEPASPRGRSDRTKSPSPPPAVSSPALGRRSSDPQRHGVQPCAARGNHKRKNRLLRLHLRDRQVRFAGMSPAPFVWARRRSGLARVPDVTASRTLSPAPSAPGPPLPHQLRVRRSLGRVSLLLRWLERPPALCCAAGEVGGAALGGCREVGG